MNRINTLLMALAFSLASNAQPWMRRMLPQNVSDYSSLVSSDGIQKRIGSRDTAPIPCMGSPKIPVVLVQFNDRKFTVADTDDAVKEKYDTYFNKKSGSAVTSLGSVYSYFSEQSYGQFTPDFKIIGPVTLSKGFAYYGKNSGSRTDVNISYFYNEACELAVSKFDVDWSSFDNNGDSKVDMVFFIFAGVGENIQNGDPNAIWPKECVTNFDVTVNGKKITFGAYGCTNELYNDEIDGIGVVCHELSHGLGLPDFYDTVNGDPAFGMDHWDVMDSGCYAISGKAPIGYSAFERDFMGWRKLVTLETDKAYSLEINPLEADGVAYKLVNINNASEYFILENRQNKGFDSYLCWPVSEPYRQYGPLHGLMISHVNYESSSWTTNNVNTTKSKQGMTIVPADGELISAFSMTYPETYSDQWAKSLAYDLYPGPNNVKEMSSYAVYKGTFGQTVTNIREVNGIIKVDINGGTIVPVLADSLKTLIATAKSYQGLKMSASDSDALTKAIAAAEKAEKEEESLRAALTALSPVVSSAKESVELYRKIAEIIAKANKLGDAGKASFAASKIEEAYNNGTLTSLTEVQKAYNAAVAAQEKANAIEGVSVLPEKSRVYGVDGKVRNSVRKGINIINRKKVVVK